MRSMTGKPTSTAPEQICAFHSAEGAPGMCLHRDHWGTVGSTIAAIAGDPRHSQYHYSPGPPCRTPYVDYSDAFKRMAVMNG